jgi:hypothetical protein
MPLEIRELHIKATVNQPAPAGGEGSSGAANAAEQPKPPSPERLIADAIEQVMEILRKKEER